MGLDFPARNLYIMGTMKNDIQLYKDTGKLSSHPHIFCSKCQGKTTAFGTNLQGKIKSFGSLEKLLSEFECRACRNQGKAPKVVRIKRKREPKITKDENQKYDIPVFKNDPPLVVNLLENKEVCQKLTRTECWRPDIYLNNSKTCDKCNLFTNCASPIKRLTRQLVRK